MRSLRRLVRSANHQRRIWLRGHARGGRFSSPERGFLCRSFRRVRDGPIPISIFWLKTFRGLLLHTGIVRAPSRATFPRRWSGALPEWAPCGSGGLATSRSDVAFAVMSSPSRRFHSARTSADGAQAIIPGWMRPGNRTPGM